MGRGRSKVGGNTTSSSIQLNGDKEILDFELDEYSAWKNTLTSSELNAVQNYGLDSTRLNGYLRGNNDAPTNMDVEGTISALDSAISHPLSSSLTVYRGVGTDYLGLDLSNEQAVKSLIGKTIHDPAYMSTAISPDVGTTYSRGTVLKINAPKGKKTMSTDIAESTKSELYEYLVDGDIGNTEIVFKRNTGLKITGYSKVSRNGKKYIQIEASMI